MSHEGVPELDFASAVSLLDDAMSGIVLEALDGTGLRRGHGYLVQRLLVGPATASEIAAELGVTQQAVSKVIKELLALGHIESVPDPVDRRRRPVQLSSRGRRAVETARAVRRDIDRRVREAIGDESFESTLSAVTAALDALGMTERIRRRAVQPPGRTLD